MAGRLPLADSLQGRWARLAGIVLLAAAYYGAAKLGLSFAFETASVTAIWPPTGLALAALVLWGHRLWPGVAIGAFLANSWTGIPLAGDDRDHDREHARGGRRCVPADRVAHFRPTLERVRDVLALVFLAGAVSTAISATIGVASLRRDRRGCGRRLRVGVARVVAGRHGRRSADRAVVAGRRHVVAVHARAGPRARGDRARRRDGRRQRARVLARDQPRVSRLPAADLGGAALLAARRHGREPRGRGDRGRLHEQRLGPFMASNPDDSLLLAQTFVGVAG